MPRSHGDPLRCRCVLPRTPAAKRPRLRPSQRATGRQRPGPRHPFATAIFRRGLERPLCIAKQNSRRAQVLRFASAPLLRAAVRAPVRRRLLSP